MSSAASDTPAPTTPPHPDSPGSASTSGAASSNGEPHGAVHPPVRWPLFLAADVVLVVVFAGTGRVSHGEDLTGVFTTAWPFLVGALIGWAVSRGSRSPAALWPTGVLVWLSAEIVGMLLRAVTGQGTALSFVIVSLVVLGIFLLGYRLVARAVDHARER